MEALGVAAGLGREAVHSQLAAALHVVVHIVRPRQGPRLVREIAVLRAGADGLVRCEQAVVFDAAGRAVAGPGARRLEQIVAATG
jgi:pilus assembly protein CpaF